MLADIKGPHLDFFGGPQQPFTRLWVQYTYMYNLPNQYSCTEMRSSQSVVSRGFEAYQIYHKNLTRGW